MAQQTSADGEDPSREGPPNWGPQRPWESGRNAGGPRMWAIVAVALVIVLGVIAGVTVYLTGDDATTVTSTAVPGPIKPDAATPAGAGPAVASAGDTAPVGVITDDPTCTAWAGIDADLKAAEQTSWSGRDPSIPAAQWTPSRRDSYDSVAVAMRAAADQAAALAAQTPHRVMRELYDQTVAYLRAYADSLPTYTAVDDHLVLTAAATRSALSAICTAVGDGTAAGRATLVAAAQSPTAAPAPAAPAASVAAGAPVPFLQPPTDPVCIQWHGLVTKYTAGFAAWRATDASLPAAQWGPNQRQISDAVAPVMTAFADDAEALAQSTTNPVFQDFATLAAQYRRAFAAALPTYVPPDGALTQAASAATLAVDEACTATDG